PNPVKPKTDFKFSTWSTTERISPEPRHMAPLMFLFVRPNNGVLFHRDGALYFSEETFFYMYTSVVLAWPREIANKTGLLPCVDTHTLSESIYHKMLALISLAEHDILDLNQQIITSVSRIKTTLPTISNKRP
ncbi:unnamed protein product, partial [Owenia fusiformis]